MFKNIEIYFLYVSSKVRWGITFSLLLVIVSCWWYFAFAPLRNKLKTFEHKFENACATNLEADQQTLLDSLNHKAITQRIAFVGDYNYFLKDLLAHGLETTSVSVEKTEKLDFYTATSIKIAFHGPFEKFFDFLREHQRNYLCLWNSCTCSKFPDGKLVFDAQITLYFQ